MARRIPQERKFLIQILKWKSKKKEISGPVFVAIVDRIAKLDGLYDAELTKPRERPDKLPNPLTVVGSPEEEKAQEDKARRESEELLREFNSKHYGGGNVRTESDATTAQSSNI